MRSLLATLIIASFAFPASGQATSSSKTLMVQTAELRSPNVLPGDHFGASVSLSGTRLAVGAPGNSSSPDPGKVYLYESASSGWALVQVFTGVAGASFGESVSLEGEVLAVGAPNANSRDGAVFVYDRNLGGAGAWGLAATHTGSVGSLLGAKVALSRGVLVATAPDWVRPPLGNPSEAAWVFERNAGGENRWGHVAWISSPIPGCDDFGTALAADGERVLVCAPEYNSYCGPFMGGTGYLFGQDVGGPSQWGIQLAFRPSAAYNTGSRGAALRGNLLAVSADAGLTIPSKVVLFENGPDGWTESDELDWPWRGSYGASIALDERLVFVGEPDRYRVFGLQGRVHVYERDPILKTWRHVQQVFPASSTADDQFGASMSFDSPTALAVGAPGRTTTSGVVSVFEVRSSIPVRAPRRHR